MSSRANWTPGYGYVWLVVCLLLLCLPPSFPALVFPNDVLASLDKYKSNEHIPKDKPSLPVLTPSFGATASLHTSKVPPPPVEAKVSHHSFHSVSEGPSVSSSNPKHDPHIQGNVNKDLFHSFPSSAGKGVEDYEDYSDYSQPLSQSRLVVTAKGPNVKDKETIPPSADPHHNHHHHSLTSSASDSLKEKGSDVRHPDSQARQEKVEGKSEKSGSTTGHVHGESLNKHDRKPEGEGQKQCPRCKIREEDRALRIESLKRKILDSLHFTTLPNRTGMPVPKALAHMIDIHSDLLQDAPYGGVHHQLYDDEDEDYTPPERVFTTAKPLPQHLGKGDKNSCYFNMPGEVFRSRVTKAFLWFYVRHASDVQSTVIQMRVDRLGPSFGRKQRSSRRIVWSQKNYPEKAFGWKKVDMTNIVRRWVKHPSSNYGLQILAINGDENLAILPPTSEEYRGYEPTLDIKVTKDSKRRYKRSDSLTCSENTTEHRCCRYPLTVIFAEFGWDWVIAPTHVKADYCSGECRMTLQNKTPYSWVASQTPDGGSCCTPSKMSPLPLLYFDHSSDVVFQMLQNMRVDRCGCA